MRLISLIGWTGAAGITVAPFFIATTGGQILAACSLLLLTIQMVKAGYWNMVLANTIGILGYIWSITA